MGCELFLFLLLSVGSAVPHLKRGIVADGAKTHTECNDPNLLQNSTTWYYDYNVYNPYRKIGCQQHYNQQFVPMHWCIDSLPTPVPPYVNQTYMLGFNEPNNRHNCNKSPETVARAWSTVMKKFPRSLLVSPATAGDGEHWFEQFFGNCTKLYGTTGCRISYLAAHWYGCDAAQTLAYLERLHRKFNHLTIWLTEFACGDHSGHKSQKHQLEYMRQVVPMLDKAPFVFRYSWFPARTHDKDDHRALFVHDKEELTQLGKLYNSL
eukprot:TRINITY_DN46352_c0_g1_i1.p1 TRINITY_DN46352_c0_g1~~TRINITY_DN46352_c0_g1_i1.p1  ORF type:complete len:264 (+),score=17.05 TRINITY_DN46352_c0_g1_i1:22-813(+)